MANLSEYEGKVIRLSTDDFLYVHKCDARALHCYRDHHPITSVTAIVKGIDDKEYALSVRYCPECLEYFISRTSYNLYIENLGFILARFEDYEKSYSDQGNMFGREIAFNDTSPLSLMGYNVNRKADTPEAVRHAFLATAMDKGFLSKDTIQLYLEQFLRVNAQGKYMQPAEEKWKSDLAFILQYNAGKQPKALIDAVVDWRSRHENKIRPYTGKIDIDNAAKVNAMSKPPRERGVYDHKDGDVKIVIRNNREYVRLFVRNHLTQAALNFLYSNGWKWNKNLKCWDHIYRSHHTYSFAYSFLSGEIY